MKNYMKGDANIISKVSRQQRLCRALEMFTKATSLFAVFGWFGGILIAWLWGDRDNLAVIAAITVIAEIIFILLAILFSKSFDKQKVILKKLLGEHIIKDVLAERVNIREYLPDGHINSRFVDRCKILPGYDRLAGSDYISGSYKGIGFTYCDLFLEKKYETKDDDGHRHTEYVTVFQGQVFTIALNQDIDGYVRIRERKNPRKTNGIFSGFLDALAESVGLKDNSNAVETENTAFNNQFEVKTSNDEMAFYILTPQFMESILRLDESADGYTNIEFSGSHVTITLNNGRDFFEVKKIIRNQKHLNKYRDAFRRELDMMLLIIDEILTKKKLFS